MKKVFRAFLFIFLLPAVIIADESVIILRTVSTVAAAPALDNSGLVVRYFIDEASGGTDPTDMIDRSGVDTAFDLAIDYQPSKSVYTEVSLNRGWEITDQAASAPVSRLAINDSSDKVRDALDGDTSMTMELVINVKVGFGSVGRVFGTTASGAEGAFMICHDGDTDGSEGYIRWEQNDNVLFAWTLNERAVWHFVIDTDEAADEDRAKVYKNGTLIADTESVTIAEGVGLDIANASFLSMGNRANDGSRAVEAIFYYAALYSDAFTQAQVTNNFDILTADDDTPGLIRFVQGTGVQSSDDDVAGIAFATTPIEGNTIAVCCATFDEALVSGDVTDTQSNTYVLEASVCPSGDGCVGIWTANNITGAATTVTCAPGAGSFPTIGIAEFKNANDSDPTGASSTNNGSSTTPDTGAFTVDDALLACVTQDNGDTTIIEDFTVIFRDDTTDQMPMNWQYSVTSGSTNPGWDFGFSVAWTAVGVSLTE